MSLAFELCCNLKLYLRLHNTPEMTVDGFSDIASRGENRKTCISKIANYCTGSSGPMPSARHIRVQVIITHYKLYNKLEGPCVMLTQRFQKGNLRV